MNSIDYSAFAKSRGNLASVSQREFDVFISSFNDSDRIAALFEAVDSRLKYIVLHPEYGYAGDEPNLPGGKVYRADSSASPAEFWSTLLELVGSESPLSTSRIAIDITGMMRTHIVMLPYALFLAGATCVTLLYSDPAAYVAGENTTFSKGPVESVGLVPGMEGVHVNVPTPKDILIIGAGYDYELIRAVAEDKSAAAHYILLGLPSLQPHMYQQSILRVDRASESLRQYRSASRLYAPAHDPFATAQVLSDHWARLNDESTIHHVYLSPVGVKTQALGFALFYWYELQTASASMVFPTSKSYARETSRGISSVHMFEVEVDLLALDGPPRSSGSITGTAGSDGA